MSIQAAAVLADVGHEVAAKARPAPSDAVTISAATIKAILFKRSPFYIGEPT